MRFNDQQLQAINHKNGACAVIAGAGSGKSTVLVNRISKLVEDGVEQKSILATTFTKNSAHDLKEKLNKLGINDVSVGTFHSVCGKILSEKGLLKSVGIKPYQIENLFNKMSKSKVDTQDVLGFISYQKNYMRGCKDEFVVKDSRYDEVELREFYKEYEAYKVKNKLMDFDDMLLNVYNLGIGGETLPKYEYILVDEHQDSNLIQAELIDMLCNTGNVFCVFDYRQAIYTFRGGNPEYCMRFKDRYTDAKVINLDYNYRSNKTIVDKANRFIEQFYGTYEYYSPSIASNQSECKIDVNKVSTREDEAKYVVRKIKELISNGVNGKDISVLYRNNIQSMNVENELKLNNIEYDIDDKNNFFKRKEIDCILSLLRLIDNPKDDGAYENLFANRISVFKFLNGDILKDIKILAAKHDISLLSASELVKTEKVWQSKNLNMFSTIVDKLTRQYKQHKSLDRLVVNAIVVLELEDYINNKYTSPDDIAERLESIENFKKFIRSNSLESFLQYVYCKNKTQKKKSDEKVKLMTIHGSKGLEFKHVFLIGVEDGKFPSSKAPLDEEARLFYVAVTRAVDMMYVNDNGESSFLNQYI